LLDELRRMEEKKFKEKERSKIELNSYVYIEDYEVRIEILIPFFLFEKWVPMARKNRDFLEIEEQESLKKPAEIFFKKYNPLEIDGIPVKPILQNLIFFPDIFSNMLKRPPPPSRIKAIDTWVGAILTYSTKGVPTEIKIMWNLFDEGVSRVSSIVYTEKDKWKTLFRPGDSTFIWHNPGHPSLPPINEITIKEKPWWAFWESVEEISEDEARAIFRTLLKNVYRAFDYNSESDIYDALAKSVEGELLTDLYIKIRKGLEMQEQGGSISHIEEVRIINGKMKSFKDGFKNESGFNYESLWTVKGTVEHWGHIHSRINRYQALFTIKAVNHAWKITDMQVLDQEIGKIESVLRQ